MTTLAYQVTDEDLINVLSSNARTAEHAQTPVETLAGEVVSLLDFEEIESAALYGDTLDEQTDYANDDITRQLRDLRVLIPLAS